MLLLIAIVCLKLEIYNNNNEFVVKIVQNPAKSHIFGGKSSISIEQPVRNPNLDEPKLVQTCPDMTRYHSWLKKWSKTMNLLPKLCKILQKVIFSVVKVQFPLNNQ